MITVVGQRGNGPVLQRTVSVREFVRAWGPWARFLLHNARDQAVEIDGCKVQVVVR